MKFPIHDWRIYRNAIAASQLSPYRQFEVVLDLEECGLRPGQAFPGWVEVEADPIADARGRKISQIVGARGSQEAPQWFLIAEAP